MPDDGLLTIKGSTLVMGTPAFDLTIELTRAVQVDKIVDPIAGLLHSLVKLVGAAVAALPEAPRSLCLAMLFQEAVEDLTEAANIAGPPAAAELGTLTILGNRTLDLSGQSRLRMELKSPDAHPARLDVHELNHLRELLGLFNWLVAAVVEQPGALIYIPLVIDSAQKMIVLATAIFLNDQGRITNEEMLGVFALYAYRPITEADLAPMGEDDAM